MAGSWRTEPLPPDWPRIRARILHRDNYECQWPVPWLPRGICAARANQVDHVLSAADGGGHDDGNLRSLCWPHHRDRSSSQGGVAMAAIRRRIVAARKRPVQPHPGLLPKETS